MKKRIVAAALAALVLGPTAPASAAVPKGKPKVSIACGEGSKKKAEVWYKFRGAEELTQLAAKNPCREWLTIGWGKLSASDGGETDLHIAPGVHFNTKRKAMPLGGIYAGRGPWARLEPVSCLGADHAAAAEEEGMTYGYDNYLVYGHRDVRPYNC
jgi:hypothetical protein